MEKIILGKKYRVTHKRKGVFVAKVLKDGDYVDLEIVSGSAKYLSCTATANKGDIIVVRKSLCTFELVEE